MTDATTQTAPAPIDMSLLIEEHEEWLAQERAAEEADRRAEAMFGPREDR